MKIQCTHAMTNIRIKSLYQPEIEGSNEWYDFTFELHTELGSCKVLVTIGHNQTEFGEDKMWVTEYKMLGIPIDEIQENLKNTYFLRMKAALGEIASANKWAVWMY